MKRKGGTFTILVALIVVGMVIVMWKFWPTKIAKAPVATNVARNTNAKVSTGSIAFSTADLPDRDPAFDFRFAMSDTWAAEYLSGPKAIIFYEPTAHTTNLETAKLVIRLATIVPSTTADHTSVVDGATVYWFKRADASAPSTLPAWVKQVHWEAWVPTTLEGQFDVLAQAPMPDDAILTAVVSSFHGSQNLPESPTQLQ